MYAARNGWELLILDANPGVSSLGCLTFEHHDGTKVIELAPGRLGTMSHGWMDTQYVHLWEP